jgi:hypothetical protein
MAAAADSPTIAIIGTTKPHGYSAGPCCGLLGIPSPLMLTSSVVNAYNPMITTKPLKTSSSFQKL